MKKSLILVLVSILILSFSGCKGSSQKEAEKLIEDYKKAQYWFKKAMAFKSVFNMKHRFDYLFDNYEKLSHE
jgi:hypothetical protein